MLSASTARCKPFAASARRAPRASLPVRCSAAATPASAATHSQLRTILDDAAGLGKCRFIVIGDGAILESVSEFNSVRYNDIPGRGVMATIASPDKAYECHITLSKVKEVRFAKSKAKAGDYDVYATRFVAEGDRVFLTCLLHGSQGVYDPAAVEAWTKLAAKHGASVKF